MATTYTWAVESMDCFPEWNGVPDVVMRVHWRCVGVDGGYTASAAGCTSIRPDPQGAFTPFEKLTQDEVVSWIKAELDAKPTNSERIQGPTSADYEREVAELIDRQRAPAVVTPPIPWG